ncbi:Zinc finger nuclear hormone receptor-type [Trinorchestia longiramus]|nr:Zinc finger nuclear hormone receptor-type [Trinorchestia longiramus]
MGLFKETRKKFKVRAPKFFGKNHRPKKRVGTCVDVNHSTAKDRECEISLAAPEIQVSLLSSTSTDDELCFNISAYDDAEVNSSVKQSKSSQSCSFSSSQTLSSFPTGSNEGKIDMILDSGPPTVVLNISAEDVDSSSLRSNLISASVSENSLISPQFQGAHGNVVLVSNNSSADHFKGGSATDVCEFLKTESSNCLSEASNILIEEAMEILEKHIRKEEEQKYYVEPVEECASSYSNNLARNDALPQLDCSGMNLFTDSCPSSDTLCESTIKNEPWDANEFTSNLDVDSFSDLIRFNRSSIHEASRSTEDTAVQDSKLPSSRISQTCANNVILEPTIQPHDPGKNEYNFFSGHLPNGVSLLPSTDLPHHLSSIEDNSSSLDAQYFATPWSQWDCTTQPFNGYDYRRDAADAAGPGWPVSDSWPHRADNESLHETASLQNHVRHLHLQKYYRDDKPLPYDSHTLPQQSYYSINHEFDSFAASSTERHYFDPYAFTYHGDRNPNQLVAPPLCGPSLPLDQHPHTPSLLLPHAHCRMDASDATVLSNNDGPKIDRRSLDGNSSAAGNSAGASPMGSPMPAGGASKTRMDRLCGVCGDRALGYNFNAITCESCKAFFRRNALKNKNLKCPFQDNCSVDTVTRRFCQKCRLRKCFEIGMKKEWIMTEEEKLKKKQKIEANKLRKQAGDSSMHPLCGSSEVSRSSPSNSPSFKTELSPSPASSTASMEHLGQAVDFHFSRRSSLEFEIPGSPEVLGKPYIHPQLNIQEKNPHVSSYVSTPGSTVLHSNETHSKPHAVVIGMVRGTESNSAGSNTGSIASKVMRLDNQSDVHHEGIDVVVSAQPPVSFTLRESALSLSHLGVCHPGVEMNPYPFSGTHGTSMHVSEPPVAPAIPVASVSPVPHMDGNSMNTATSFREALTVLSPEAARTHPQAFSDATQSPPQGNIPQTSPTPHFSFTSNESVPNMFSPTLGISQNDPRQHHRDFAPLDSFSLTASPTTTSEIRPLANHPLTTSVPHVTHTEPSSNASSDYKDFGSIAQNRQSASVNLLTGTSSLPDESVCAATDHASTSDPSSDYAYKVKIYTSQAIGGKVLSSFCAPGVVVDSKDV